MPVLDSGGFSLPGPLVAVVFVAVGAGVLAVFARRGVRRFSVVPGTETTPVADVEPGRVEVEGTVADAGETVQSKPRSTVRTSRS